MLTRAASVCSTCRLILASAFSIKSQLVVQPLLCHTSELEWCKVSCSYIRGRLKIARGSTKLPILHKDPASRTSIRAEKSGRSFGKDGQIAEGQRGTISMDRGKKLRRLKYNGCTCQCRPGRSRVRHTSLLALHGLYSCIANYLPP